MATVKVCAGRCRTSVARDEEESELEGENRVCVRRHARDWGTAEAVKRQGTVPKTKPRTEETGGSSNDVTRWHVNPRQTGEIHR